MASTTRASSGCQDQKYDYKSKLARSNHEKSKVEINNFREAFERGEDPLADVTDASDINSVAGVLKLYLRELREPVFSIQYFDQFMELASKKSMGRY